MTDKTACSGVLPNAICICFFANFGAIAQLGERLLCKQEVVGSIPSGSTTSSKIRKLSCEVGKVEFRDQKLICGLIA